MAVKNRKVLGIAIEKKTYEKLKELSRLTTKPMSRLLDVAINELYEKFKREGKL